MADLFRTLRVTTALYFRARLTGSWGIRVPQRQHTARFHLLLSGSCRIEVEDQHIELEAGDLAVIPEGVEHTLLSARGATVFPLEAVLDETAYDNTRDLTYGGGGPTDVLVCGHFGFDDAVTHPIIEAFPSLLHIRAAEGHDFVWLDAASRSVQGNPENQPPGQKAVVERISELLFIQVLQSLAGGETTSKAMAAFSDKHLSVALQAIHADPQRNWDLETLASLAKMSRTTFAVRFREHLGMPPMAYTTQWRLQKARLALVESDAIVAAIAADHGYQSEASFSRAFQRLYGKPPATYRREHHTSIVGLS